MIIKTLETSWKLNVTFVVLSSCPCPASVLLDSVFLLRLWFRWLIDWLRIESSCTRPSDRKCLMKYKNWHIILLISNFCEFQRKLEKVGCSLSVRPTACAVQQPTRWSPHHPNNVVGWKWIFQSPSRRERERNTMIVVLGYKTGVIYYMSELIPITTTTAKTTTT